jgi:hypothetical protein
MAGNDPCELNKGWKSLLDKMVVVIGGLIMITGCIKDDGWSAVVSIVMLLVDIVVLYVLSSSVVMWRLVTLSNDDGSSKGTLDGDTSCVCSLM